MTARALPLPAEAPHSVQAEQACAHENKHLVWSEVGTSGYRIEQRQLRWQCQDCGCLLRNAVSHSQARPNTPNVDLNLLASYLESGAHLAQNIVDTNALNIRWRAEQKEKYAGYLESPEWHEKRHNVLFRAGGICEGCRQRKATQVHHLTYENIGEEFLWQLVAVCRSCHERYHGIG